LGGGWRKKQVVWVASGGKSTKNHPGGRLFGWRVEEKAGCLGGGSFLASKNRLKNTQNRLFLEGRQVVWVAGRFYKSLILFNKTPLFWGLFFLSFI
jgi:hypothetical protein